MSSPTLALVVHESPFVDAELLDYAALLASLEERTRVFVAAVPSASVLPSFASRARSIFAARGCRDVGLEIITEPDETGVFDALRRSCPDLLVVRHPRRAPGGRALARRYLGEVPCAVCFVPEGSPPRLDRVAVGIDLSAEAGALLTRAVALCDAAGTRELLAVHVLPSETWSHDPRLDTQHVDDARAALDRLVAEAGVGAGGPGPTVTTVVTSAPSYGRALARAAEERDAGVVIVGRSWGAKAPLVTRRRDAEALLWECPVPLLQVPIDDRGATLSRALGRLFSTPEPRFG